MMMSLPSPGMQQPTLTNIHIRSPEDAHKVFYAVQLGLLPEITRRLDAQERKQLASGNVYCWADKPAGETHTFEAGGSGQSTRAGLGMQAGQPPAYEFTIERWTEGLSWSASRIRDDFLIYFENEKKKGDREGRSTSQRARSLENQVHREGERDMFIKQTYSAYRSDDFPEDMNQDGSLPNSAGASTAEKKKKPRKWHLNAYFTKSTEGDLNTIDSIPELRGLVVPEGMFRSARNSTKKKAGGPASTSMSSDPPQAGALYSGEASGSGVAGARGKRGRDGSSVQRTYAPFPSGDRQRPRPVAPAPPTTIPAHHSSSPSMGQHNNLSVQTQMFPPPLPPMDVQHLRHSASYTQVTSFSFPPIPTHPHPLQHQAHQSQEMVHSPTGYGSPPGDVFSNLGYSASAPNNSTSYTLGDALSPVSSPTTNAYTHHNMPFSSPPQSNPMSFDFNAGSYSQPSMFASPGLPNNAFESPLAAHQHARRPSRGHGYVPHNNFSPHSGSSGTDSPAQSDLGSWHTPSPRPGSSIGSGSGQEEDLSAYLPMPALDFSTSNTFTVTDHSNNGNGSIPRSRSFGHQQRHLDPIVTTTGVAAAAMAMANGVMALSASLSTTDFGGLSVDSSVGGGGSLLSAGAAGEEDYGYGSESESESDSAAQRVALAPLHTLQRNHGYRRSPMDDRALRLLGPPGGGR